MENQEEPFQGHSEWPNRVFEQPTSTPKHEEQILAKPNNQSHHKRKNPDPTLPYLVDLKILSQN